MAFSAHTAAKYSAVLSGVFWHIVCAVKKKDQWLSKQRTSYIILQTKQHPVPLCMPQNKIWSFRTINNFAVNGHCLFFYTDIRHRGEELFTCHKLKVKLTSSSSGSLVTRCMGRMRKEIIGRPPHSALPSICFRVSLNSVLLVLTGRKKKRRNISSSICYAAEMHSSSML